jgi:chlorobactene glucosyltransferase
MTVAIVAVLWAAVIAYLLARVVAQGRVYRTASLAVGLPQEASSVMIVVPARDEIANIADCLASLVAQRGLPGRCDIVVVDDGSADGTAEAAAAIAAAQPAMRLLRAGALPPGWMGKPHACWRGAKTGDSEWLCFIDADLRAEPLLVASAVAAAETRGIDMLSVSPFHDLGSFWERLILPAGMLLIAGAMDLRRVGDPGAGEVAAAGQFLLFRRAAYRAIGGHAAVRGEICEDKALARLTKNAGLRYRLLAGEDLARTRLYRDLPSLWEGLAKNAVEILGSSAASVVAATAGLAAACLAVALPLWAAAAAIADPSAARLAGLALCAAASLIAVGLHLGTLAHCRVRLAYGLLFPAAYGAAAALAWSSLAARRAGRVRWKGRTYDLAAR